MAQLDEVVPGRSRAPQDDLEASVVDRPELWRAAPRRLRVAFRSGRRSPRTAIAPDGDRPGQAS